MKIRRTLVTLFIITLLYLSGLVWLDSRNQVFAKLPEMLSILPALAGLSFISYMIRYLRWHWLLARAGSRIAPDTGFLAYMAGFAFTATPGKLGELLRIRYLAPQGVLPWRVLAAFVFERAFDLIVVLCISMLAISRHDVFFFALGFVLFVIVAVGLLIFTPGVLTRLAVYLRYYRLKRIARISTTLRDGMSGCRVWLTLPDILMATVLGFAAWVTIAYAFTRLLSSLEVSIPFLSALAIYPLSMLAGAASMLPGGVGSTEVSIVALLSIYDVPVEVAVLAAIGIRLATMWFAVLCGLCAMVIMEYHVLK